MDAWIDGCSDGEQEGAERVAASDREGDAERRDLHLRLYSGGYYMPSKTYPTLYLVVFHPFTCTDI